MHVFDPMIALELLCESEESVFEEACAALESIGFEGPMYSSGPLERLRKLLREEILPRINRSKALFEEYLEKAKSNASALLRSGKELASDAQRDLVAPVATYIADMQKEGLAGKKTARLVILIATADALQKTLSPETGISFSELTLSEWLMIALAYLRLSEDLGG